jgi:hypothetical protein
MYTNATFYLLHNCIIEYDNDFPLKNYIFDSKNGFDPAFPLDSTEHALYYYTSGLWNTYWMGIITLSEAKLCNK